MMLLKSTESKMLFLLLVVMAILYIVKPENGSKRALNEAKKASNHKIDSISTLYTRAMRRINKLEIEVKESHLERLKAQEERDIAKRQAQIDRKKYENIKFINLSNDSKRDSVLMALYPSFRK